MQVDLIGMEACAGPHFLGKALREQGHDVRLMPAQYVKPFVKTNKNGFIDAEAIAEAVSRPTMRFVSIMTSASGTHARTRTPFPLYQGDKNKNLSDKEKCQTCARDEMSVNSPAIHISDKPSQIRPCKPRCGSRGS
jgi:hypothetical protein